MPSTYTSSLNIEKPADGEQDGVWGDIVNSNMEILDRVSDGQTTQTLTGTASSFNVISTDGQRKILILAGTPSGTHTITLFPNTSQKIYFVQNTTAQSVIFTQGSGGNITLTAGDSAILYATGAGATSAVLNLADHFSMSSVNITGGTIAGGTIAGVTSAGIGTSTVDSLMTLQDDADITGPILTFKNQYRLTTTVADIMGGVAFSVWRDTSPTKSYNAAIYAKNTGYPGGAGNLIFATQTNGGTDPAAVAERMRITSTGNVGIGTLTPGQALDVVGTGAFSVSVATPALTNAAGTRGPNFTKGYVETVFALTGTTPALNPANGSIQTWTLTANSTPTDSVAAGESLTLMIDDGTAFAITWPSVTWKTNAGVAPTLNLTSITAIVLWKVGSVLYGARVGDA